MIQAKSMAIKGKGQSSGTQKMPNRYWLFIKKNYISAMRTWRFCVKSFGSDRKESITVFFLKLNSMDVYRIFIFNWFCEYYDVLIEWNGRTNKLNDLLVNWGTLNKPFQFLLIGKSIHRRIKKNTTTVNSFDYQRAFYY